MDNLLKAITTLVADQKPEKIVILSDLVKQCQDSINASILKNWSTTSKTNQQLTNLIYEWGRTSVTPDELSGMLIGSSHAYHRAKYEEQTELVWTGPTTPLLSTRRTEQALLEVINSSKESLFIVSFVAYSIESISKALNAAIYRGVKVSILMEPSEAEGGYLKGDCFESMKASVPEAKLYVWSDKNKEELGGGYRVVHIKCSVADGNVAFITSANLTDAALERNMELGLLIRGQAIPKILENHLNALVVTNILVPYK